MISNERKKLKKIKSRALDCVHQMNYRSARKELKKLKRSFMVSEAIQIEVEVMGLMLYHQKKLEEACKLVTDNLGYVWGNPFAWLITRQINARTTAMSKRFTLKITGSGIGLGVFTYYPPEYIATFDVVAASPEMAVKYIRKIVNFEDPDRIQIVSEQDHAEVPEEIEFEGVLCALPFEAPEARDDKELLEDVA